MTDNNNLDRIAISLEDISRSLNRLSLLLSDKYGGSPAVGNNNTLVDNLPTPSSNNIKEEVKRMIAEHKERLKNSLPKTSNVEALDFIKDG